MAVIYNLWNVSGPLSGSAELNIYDKAWATVHLGLLGFDFHIFLADLCYKGSIGYDLNILEVRS